MHQRIEKLRARIRQFKLDALLITSLANLRYLFGFTGSNAIALITSDLCYFITDRRYTLQAKEQVSLAEIIISKKDLISELKGLQVLNPGDKLGFEAMHLTVKSYMHLKKSTSQIKLIASEKIVEKIASVKDSDELACIQKAARICGEVFEKILPLIKPGMGELDLSAELSYQLKLQGSEKDPFEPIVISGKRTAFPHGNSSEKKIQTGDLLIMDFGAMVNGYGADVSRTIVLGTPSPKQKEMVRIVLGALQRSETAAKPGLTGKELDRVARDYMNQYGYKKYFQHSLGHGLGLEVHGLPRVGELSEDRLEVGNVIALEPGVYLPEIGGVRIEDDYVITNEGVENLSQFPRDPFQFN